MYIRHLDIKARWFRRVRNSILQSTCSGEEIMIDITYDSELKYALKMKLAIKYYSRSILVTLSLFNVGLDPGRRQVKMGKSAVVHPGLSGFPRDTNAARISKFG